MFQQGGLPRELAMASISFDDRSGKLVQALIWEQQAAAPDQTFKGRVYGEYTGKGKFTDIRRCSLDKEHSPRLACEEVWIDLFGGKVLGNFIPLSNHGFNII